MHWYTMVQGFVCFPCSKDLSASYINIRSELKLLCLLNGLCWIANAFAYLPDQGIPERFEVWETTILKSERERASLFLVVIVALVCTLILCLVGKVLLGVSCCFRAKMHFTPFNFVLASWSFSQLLKICNLHPQLLPQCQYATSFMLRYICPC